MSLPPKVLAALQTQLRALMKEGSRACFYLGVLDVGHKDGKAAPGDKTALMVSAKAISYADINNAYNRQVVPNYGCSGMLTRTGGKLMIHVTLERGIVAGVVKQFLKNFAATYPPLAGIAFATPTTAAPPPIRSNIVEPEPERQPVKGLQQLDSAQQLVQSGGDAKADSDYAHILDTVAAWEQTWTHRKNLTADEILEAESALDDIDAAALNWQTHSKAGHLGRRTVAVKKLRTQVAKLRSNLDEAAARVVQQKGDQSFSNPQAWRATLRSLARRLATSSSEAAKQALPTFKALADQAPNPQEQGFAETLREAVNLLRAHADAPQAEPNVQELAQAAQVLGLPPIVVDNHDEAPEVEDDPAPNVQNNPQPNVQNNPQPNVQNNPQANDLPRPARIPAPPQNPALQALPKDARDALARKPVLAQARELLHTLWDRQVWLAKEITTLQAREETLEEEVEKLEKDMTAREEMDDVYFKMGDRRRAAESELKAAQKDTDRRLDEYEKIKPAIENIQKRFHLTKEEFDTMYTEQDDIVKVQLKVEELKQEHLDGVKAARRRELEDWQGLIRKNVKDYRLGDELGSGGFAAIKELKGKGGPPLLLKVADDNPDNEVAAKVLLQREAEAYAKIGPHPNIARCAGIQKVQDQNGKVQEGLVIEKIEGKDLEHSVGHMTELLNRNKITASQYWGALRPLMRGALEGLKQMHQQGLGHSDIKPPNIMFDTVHKRAVLIDMGLAQAEDQPSKGGTLGYAPDQPKYGEKKLNAENASEQLDLFAIGRTLEDIQVSAESVQRPQQPQHPAKKELKRPTQRGKVPNTAQARLMMKLVQKKPLDRGSIDEALSDPFFTDADPSAEEKAMEAVIAAMAADKG